MGRAIITLVLGFMLATWSGLAGATESDDVRPAPHVITGSWIYLCTTALPWNDAGVIIQPPSKT